MKKVRLKQLGNGGAFDYESVNSSFLIETNDNGVEYLLFDCGYSVYAELRRQDKNHEIDLSKLTKVYISHVDDDHIGSLKTLIYYMYFIHNTILEIIANKEVYKALKKYLSDINGEYKYGRKIKKELFILTDSANNKLNISNNTKIEATITNHLKPCYGIQLYVDNTSLIYISGDTKVLSNHFLKRCKSEFMFHDFSNWNSQESQVHACEEDYAYYTPGLREKMIKYHNNEPFNSAWQKVISKKE